MNLSGRARVSAAVNVFIYMCTCLYLCLFVCLIALLCAKITRSLAFSLHLTAVTDGRKISNWTTQSITAAAATATNLKKPSLTQNKSNQTQNQSKVKESRNYNYDCHTPADNQISVMKCIKMRYKWNNKSVSIAYSAWARACVCVCQSWFWYGISISICCIHCQNAEQIENWQKSCVIVFWPTHQPTTHPISNTSGRDPSQCLKVFLPLLLLLLM